MKEGMEVVTETEAVEYMTDIMAEFVGCNGKVLPDDVMEKLKKLRVLEAGGLPKTVHDTMFRNQRLVAQLDRPCCQDTGVLQCLVKYGIRFPLIDFMESLLKKVTVRATFNMLLRHNSVGTFDEYNTGKNVEKGTPTIFREIVSKCDTYEVYSYMAGGGYSLPGKTMVLIPGQGYGGVTKFVLDVATNYGLSARPPLLVGVRMITSVETAALLSKKALFRTLGSKSSNERAAKLEELLEDGISEVGPGPQGVSGKMSVVGVHVENTVRHPPAIGVAVNVRCWSRRKEHIILDKDLKYTIMPHKGATLW